MNESSSLYTDENLFRSIVESSPAGLLIADAEGRIILANRAAGEQFGYEIAELIDQPVDRLLPDSSRRAHRTHRARYMSHPEPRSMAAGRDLFGERKDGSLFPVDISLHPIEVNGEQMVVANVLDATDRRRAEQEREQRQAMERLALLGQLAGGVAHEIRTPLCVIRNDAYFLKMLSDRLGDEGNECVDEINEAVGKAERIVSELLDFTRDPQSEPQEVKVGDLIDAALRGSSIPAGIEIFRSGDRQGVCARVDPEQIERILINLLRNAVQAIGDSGKIRLDTKTVKKSVVISVTDDGDGMEPGHVDRVFEPLFTTKPKGIGLGLAVSRRYAERNGGSLTAENGDEGGACFRLTIPMVCKKE